MWFANALTELFEGQFDFSTCLSNQRAVKFWSKFIQSFEQSEYADDDTKRNWCIRKNAFREHTLNLAPQYFNLIKSGEKTLEGRLNDEKRQNFNIGDKITFYKEPERTETMRAIILQKYLFKDFDEMADSLDKKLLGFEDSTKQQMVDVYRTIYSKADENQYGIAVFKIKTID